MRHRALVAALTVALCVAVALPAAAQEPAPVEITPGNVWQQRNDDLVALASLLGRLHHFQQVCRPVAGPDSLFRDRMMELAALEEPFADLREQMVTGFNDSYNEASATFPICSLGAEADMRRDASMAEVISARLGAPFRQVEGYDYAPGGANVIENGTGNRPRRD